MGRTPAPSRARAIAFGLWWAVDEGDRDVIRTVARALVAVAALAFAIVSYIWVTTPDVRSLRTRNPTTTAFMRLRAAEAEAAGRKPRAAQRWVSYSRVSPELILAVRVTEDAAFFQHDGIDYDELVIAVEAGWARGAFTRGASTITQQLAKNLYLSPSRNPVRKLSELFIARRLEAELTKRRIFELYLNLIEWGHGIWGAEAAAQAYFGIPASDVSREQAALMAGAIINPRVYNVGRPNTRLLRRQQIILGRMARYAPVDLPK